jgi:DNA methyltransferase 1-associated protein 1
MTSHDVRDMLDLPSAAGPRPAKKQKTVGPRPNLKGLQREVQSLGGDNPIAIVPEVPLFKKRRLVSRKPAAHWELKPFKNSARKDGLILKHWRRKAEAPPVASVEGADGESAEAKAEPEIDDSLFAKFNVQVNIPTYDDEQYEAHLKSEDWSKEETDYLMSLAQDFDLRWPVIWDRYDYQLIEEEREVAEDESEALFAIRKVRSIEDLKARYYEVAAKMMAILHPVQFMSQAEFSLHQLMTSFNPQQERLRKQFAEAAMSRSAEERREEESLLIELKRIMARSEKLNEERKELYARLESPPSTSNVGIYTTSQGLAQLLQQLMSANKSKQRKSLMGPDGVSPAAGPSGQQNLGLDRRESSHRESLSGLNGPSAANKKGPSASERRKLSPEEESLYGVSHHERLTGGPSFRHDRVTRQITNKSAVQATKITNTLTELEVPTRLIMPTAEVTAQYELLLASINTLLDTKKVADKLDAEIKLAEAQKAEREKRERKEKGEPEEEANGDTNGDVDADADAEMADADGEEGDDEVKMEQSEKEKSAAPSTRTAGSASLHKRSASVLSQVSDKSTKRQKK